MTVRELREKTMDLPDDSEVLVEMFDPENGCVGVGVKRADIYGDRIVLVTDND